MEDVESCCLELTFVTMNDQIKACQVRGAALPRICIVLETEEESGSGHLLDLLDRCKAQIGTPELCLCLDTIACDYSTVWLMSSLRGIVSCHLTVEILTTGGHSGQAGGVIPESFSIIR